MSSVGCEWQPFMPFSKTVIARSDSDMAISSSYSDNSFTRLPPFKAQGLRRFARNDGTEGFLNRTKGENPLASFAS